MWKKQTAATLAVCFFIVSSESNRTLRSRTTSESLIVLSISIVSDRSCDDLVDGCSRSDPYRLGLVSI